MPSIVISRPRAIAEPTLPVRSPGMLPALERHPHARAVLGAALPPAGSPSHAYLFHGPAGSGKRAAALEFSAELLAEGARDPANARERVLHGVHPDLTVVTPSGAADLLVGDVDEAVVAAASRTPFESTRRVFVIECADRMNDPAANRMLKTLEEPADYVHLVLLADRLSNVLPTIASRCQHVRFEAPGAAEIASRLETRHGVVPAQALACARLALGDGDRALALALGEGPALRHAAEAYARAMLSGALSTRPWLALLEQAKAHGDIAAADVTGRVAAEAEYLPDRDARRAKKEGEQAARRAGRRAGTETIDLGLQLAGLWLRDVACLKAGAPDLIAHADRAEEVAADAEAFVHQPARLHDAVAEIEEARTTLILNPSEELLLETLASRIELMLRS
jgi:DNA polymerase-3 subunit delta'